MRFGANTAVMNCAAFIGVGSAVQPGRLTRSCRLADAGVLDTAKADTAIRVQTALSRSQTYPVADKLARWAAKFLAITGTVAAGVVTTGSSGGTTVRAARGRSPRADASAAVPGLASRARYRSRRWRWTAGALRGGCASQSRNGRDDSRCSAQERSAGGIRRKTFGEIVESISIHA